MSRSITRQAIADEAAKRGWSIELISQFDKSLYVITDDKGRSSIGRGGRFMDASMHGREISINKHLSYAYIERLGYKLLPHIVYDEPIEAFQFLHTHAPIVVKPIDAEQSKGVTVDIVQDDQLASALVEAKRYSLNGNVLLQAQVEGKLYRILVVNGKYFAAAYRRPAFVVGDGVLTIEALIADKNKDPLRSKDGPTPLKTIPIEDARALLGEVRLREVLPAGEICEVSSIASISRGGEAEDVTDIVNLFTERLQNIFQRN